MEKLHLLHARAGWPSVRRIARQVAVSHDTVHKLFTSATVPSPLVLLKICSFLASEAGEDEDQWCDEIDMLWNRANLASFGDAGTDPTAEGGAVHPAAALSTERVPRNPSGTDAVRQSRRLGHRSLPDALSLSTLLGASQPEKIKLAWDSHGPSDGVPIGVDPDGKAVFIDISRDGPHALIAGTSGAGKSEFLRSLILSLALNHPPSRLTFFFIDYKGGGTVSGLLQAPHLVGSATNLDARLARRVVAGLQSEIYRRQQAFSAVGAGSLEAFWRLSAQDLRAAPPPRLLLIVDELSEVRQQLPEFVDALVVAARVGRAVGVHLVLATQKTAGVVDASIRANCDLRVCLRLPTPGDSIDVLGTIEAADIPRVYPGRALVSIGGKPPVLVQLAISSRSDRPNGRPFDQEAIDAIRETAAAHDELEPPRPMLAPLPDIVSLRGLTRRKLSLCLGLQDDLLRKEQESLNVDLGTGHFLLVGSRRTGRTSALRSLAAGLALENSCKDLHIFAISRTAELASLRAFPHVGGVLSRDDPVALKRILGRVAEEVRNRLHSLESYGVNHIDELGDTGPARWVVLIDDWRQISVESNSTAQTALLEILESGSRAGVTICLAGDERLAHSEISQLFEYRLCFRVVDPQVGPMLGMMSTRSLLDLPPGRVVRSVDGTQDTEIQTPLLDSSTGRAAATSALQVIAEEVRHNADSVDPAFLPIHLEGVAPNFPIESAYELGGAPWLSVPSALLGVAEGDRLSAVWADLRRGPIAVAGPRGSGRSVAARVLAVSAASRGLRVTVVSPDRWTHVHPGENLTFIKPDELQANLERRPQFIIFDDADLVPFDEAMADLFQSGVEPFLAITARVDSFSFGARDLVKAVRRQRMQVVLLSPPNHLAAEAVGVRISRDEAFSGPPGRAVFRTGDWQAYGQVPDPGTD